METSSKTTTGSPIPVVGALSRAGAGVMRLLSAKDANHGAADEEVHDDDEDGGDDDGLCRRSADALGSAFGVHAEVAADGRDDEAGEERLGEALRNAGVGEGAVRAVEVGGEVQAQHGDANQSATGDPDCVRDDGKEEEHENGGDEPRRDKLADRVGAQGAHGIDLLGDLHRAELGCHAGCVSAGDHEAGEHGTKLLDHRERDQAAGHADCAEGLERAGGLECEHATGEKSGENDDWHGADADGVHLGEDVVPVVRAGKDVSTARPVRREYSWTEATCSLIKTSGETKGIDGSLYQMRA
jgi:hypothetical protein